MSEAPRTDWNAAVYDRIGTPMRGWAQQVIADVTLRGAEPLPHTAAGPDPRPGHDKQRPEPFAAALRAAKKAVDPHGILNPGVLIDP